MEQSESVGTIALDLILNNKLEEQLNAAIKKVENKVTDIGVGIDLDIGKSLEQSVKKSAKKAADVATETMQDAINDATFTYRGKVDLLYQTDGIEDAVTKSVDDAIGAAERKIDGISTGGGSSVYTKEQPMGDGLSSTVNNVQSAIDATAEKAKTIPEIFSAATDPAELLRQKQENIEMQIASTTAKLEGMVAEFARMEDASEYGDDFDKLGESITKTEGKLISLEESLSATKAKIKKLQDASVPSAETKKQESAVEKLQKKIDSLEKKVKEIGNAKGNGSASTSKGSSGNIASSFKGIGKIAVILKALEVLLKGISDAVSTVIQGNLELRTSLKQVQGNLQVAFQPIIDVITPLLDSLLSKMVTASRAFAEFIARLFGTTYEKAKANATKLEAIAKSTANSLLSIDELNVKSSDSNLAYLDDSNYDTSWLDEIFGKLEKVQSFFTNSEEWSGVGTALEGVGKTIGSVFKQLLSSVSKTFEDIKSLGPSLAKWFSKDLPKSLKIGIETASNVFGGLAESADMVFNDIWEDSAFPLTEKLTNDLLPALTEFADEFTLTLGEACEEAKKSFDTVWTEGINPALSNFSAMFCDVVDIIAQKWEEYGAPIFEGIRTAIDGIGQIFSSVWENILSPIWNNIVKKVQELWENNLKPLVEKIAGFVAKIVLLATTIWNNFIAPVAKWFVENLAGPIVNTFNRIVNTVKTVFAAICDIVSPIIDFFSGIIDFFQNVFEGDWEEAWESICGAFTSLWEGIKTVAKTVVNALITAVNWVIGGIYDGVVGFVNGILKGVEEVASWFGADWDITLPEQAPEIPLLAKGGIVNQPTLAMIGEAGKEAVVPLENNTEWMEALAAIIVSALQSVMQQQEPQQNYDYDEEEPIILDGDTIIGWLRKRNWQWKKQTGKILFE